VSSCGVRGLKLLEQSYKDHPQVFCSLLIKTLMNPDLSASSLQFGFFSPADTCFTPESCRSLLLRSSSVRLEDGELRAEDRAAHPSSERLQTLSLKRQ